MCERAWRASVVPYIGPGSPWPRSPEVTDHSISGTPRSAAVCFSSRSTRSSSTVSIAITGW